MTFHHLSIEYLLGIGIWIALGIVAFVVLLKLRRRWRIQGRKKLQLGTHIGLSLWFVLFLLTLGEFYFATILDQSDSFNMTLVAQKWYKLHIEPDQKTLKFPKTGEGVVYRDDREFPETVAAQQKHVCIIGDSFAFGHGVANVKDRLSNRLRRSLEEMIPGRFLVSNLANAGQNLDWVEKVLLHLFEEGHQVNTVIYVMCLNDIEHYHPDRYKLYLEDLPRVAPRFFLLRHSYMMNFLYFRFKQHLHPQVKNYYAFVRDYYDGPPWEEMQAKLFEVQELCRVNEAEFRVVVFPFLHNLGEDYEFRQAHEKIIAYCNEKKIPVIDLDPVLTPHVSKGLTVNSFDAHPNELAHQVAAEAIFKIWYSDRTAEN